MPIRQPIAFVTLFFWFALAAPAHAGSVSPLALTPGRLAASLAALIGLIGVAAGGLALARARRSASAPGGASLALLAGLTSIALGGVVVASAKGGLGTGHGLGGGVLALVAGSLSVALAGLTRSCTRRSH